MQMQLAAARPRRVSRELSAEGLLHFACTWQATVLIVLAAAVSGGYMGGVSALYAWVLARKVVLDSSFSAQRRAYVGVLAVASAIVLYSTAFELYKLLLPA